MEEKIQAWKDGHLERGAESSDSHGPLGPGGLGGHLSSLHSVSRHTPSKDLSAVWRARFSDSRDPEKELQWRFTGASVGQQGEATAVCLSAPLFSTRVGNLVPPRTDCLHREHPELV